MIVVAVATALLSGCGEDARYRIAGIDDISKDVTLFQNGIRIPVGNTEKIQIDSLLNSLGDGFGEYLRNEGDTLYSIVIDDSTNLEQAINDLDLKNIATLKGASFEETFTQNIGITSEDISIEGSTFEKTITVADLSLSDFKLPSYNLTIDDIHPDLGQYAPTDDDLSIETEVIDKRYGIIRKGELSELAGRFPTGKFPIPTDILSMIELEQYKSDKENVTVELDENISDIRNVTLVDDARVIVNITVENCLLTDGTIMPDINVDMSEVFIMQEGGSTISLKDVTLSPENGWTASQSYGVKQVISSCDGNSIDVSPNATISGRIVVQNAKTSASHISQVGNDEMKLLISVEFADFTIRSADVSLADYELERREEEKALDFTATVPDELNGVEKVSFDDNPVRLRVSTEHLPKNISVNTFVKVTFPDNIEFRVEPNSSVTVNDNVITIREDINRKDIDQNIYIVSVAPEYADGTVQLHDRILVEASATAGGSLNITELRDPQVQDAVVKVSLDGGPEEITDYNATNKKILYSVNEQFDHNFVIDGLDELPTDTFIVIPEGRPELTINFTLPEIDGVDIRPDDDGIVISLPKMLKIEGLETGPDLEMDETENIITIRNSFPEQLVLPVKELVVTPEYEDGEYLVKARLISDGFAAVMPGEITKETVDLLGGTEIGITAIMPDMKTAEIKMVGEYELKIDSVFEITFLKAEDIPDEIIGVNEGILDNVYANVDIQIDNLPELTEGEYRVDATLELPDFIQPDKVEISANLDKDGRIAIEPVRIERIRNLQLDGDIIRDIAINAAVSIRDASLKTDNLDNDITAHVKATIGDRDGNIVFSRVSGYVNEEISATETIELGDIPDELKTEGTTLDISNPQLILNLSTNLGVPVTGNISLIPWRNGEEDRESTVTVTGIRMPYSDSSSKTVGRNIFIAADNGNCPDGYDYYKANLADLIRHIPDSIQIQISANTDSGTEAVVEPMADYTYDIAYNFRLPLEFGENLDIASEESVDLDDISDYLDMGAIGIEGTVVNGTPLAIRLDISLIDDEGCVVKQSELNQPVYIGAGTSTPFKIYIDPEEGTDTGSIRHIRISFEVTAANGKIKPSDSIQLTDICVVIPEGITITGE